MADITEIVAGSHWKGWRIAMWGIAAVLLSLPAIFSAPWTAGDFIVMGMMLGTACGAAELVAYASGNGAYRMGAGIAIGAAFLTIWVNLAVGMIGDEGDPLNLMFGGVLAIALVGAIVARFEAAGMVRAMIVAAAAQAAAGAIGLSTDTRGAVFSMLFSLPWLMSAGLFRKAARETVVPAA